MDTPLLNLSLLTILLLLLAHSLRTALRTRKSITEPTCAVCRYSTLHLTTPICPECGNNLTITGILPPGQIRLRFRNAFVWSAILLCVCMLCSALTGMIRHYHESIRVDLRPASPPVRDVSFVLDLYSEGYSHTLPSDQVALYGCGAPTTPGAQTILRIIHGRSISETAVPAGPRATITFHRRRAEWELTDPLRTIRTATLTDTNLDAWLTAIGLPSDLPRARELALILDAAKDATNIRSFTPPPAGKWNNRGGGSTGGAGPDPILQFLQFWLFLFLWAWSLRYTLPGLPRPLRGIEAARLLHNADRTTIHS